MSESGTNNRLYSNHLATLEELLRVIRDASDRDSMRRRVIRDLARTVGGAAWLWIAEPGGQGWWLAAGSGLEPDFAAHLAALPTDSEFVTQLSQGCEIAGEWPAAWGGFGEALAAAGWTDAVAVPVREKTRIIGAVALARREGLADDDDLHLLRGVAVALGSLCVGDGCAPRVRAEEADRLRIAIDQLAEAILITDAQGAIEYTNPAFTSITGYTAEEARGENPRILKSGKHGPEFYAAMWDTLRRGEIWVGRLYNRCKDGTIILEEARISPVRQEDGTVTHYVAVKRDVTPEAALELKLRETQKLEAIGTLAGGIAHDFNNILYALTGYAQLTLEELDEDHPVYPYVAEIAKAGERAAGLVTKMATFGQRSSSGRSRIRVQEVLGVSLDLARATLPATIEFDLDIDGDCPEVEADAAQVQQMIMNLCTNAGDALGAASGTLSVSLAAVDIGSAEAPDWPGLEPGRWVRIRVGDTGPGIDPAMQDRIFEPYFTTQKLHEGTGLGLAIVHGIVINHEGSVHVQSEQGQGTVFTIFLPPAEREKKAVSPSEGAVMSDQKCRILLIDDEKMIVDMTQRGLKRFGFEVTGLLDGVQAVEIFRQDPYGFDAVVTDQTMPQMTGFEVAAKLLEIRPDLPIILTSGYNDLGGEEKVREAGIARMLPKPLKLSDLAHALEELTGVATK